MNTNELKIAQEQKFSLSILKSIKLAFNDGLFWFAIVLFLLIGMYAFSNEILGKSLTIGLNEVIVSLLGFFNIFFIKFTKKYLRS